MMTETERAKRAFEASGTAVFETSAGQVLIKNGSLVGKDEAILELCEALADGNRRDPRRDLISLQAIAETADVVGK